MSEMVEKVAKAICFKETGIDPETLFRAGGFGEPKEPRPLWKSYEKNARAAIEAMRLEEAAINACFLEPTPYAVKYYHAVIDAALRSTTPQDEERG